MIRRPPRSTLFPYTTPSDLTRRGAGDIFEQTMDVAWLDGLGVERGQLMGAVGRAFGVETVIKDRKSTRLNSSHQIISYAVFCLKKKKLRVRDARDYVDRHVL